MEYHLRLSTTKENGLILLDAFLASFKPVEIVSAYENKGTREDGTIINPHCHSYLKYETVPTKQAISAFFKKWSNLIIKPTTETAGYSHTKQKKGTAENIIYTIKGGDILKNTLGDQIKEYQQKTEQINQNKQLSSRDKILNEWVAEYGPMFYPHSKFHLFEFIDKIYVLKWKKSPLAYGHKVSYSIYILLNIHDLALNKDNTKYNKLMHSLYNINETETQYEQNMDLFVKQPKVKINLKKLYQQNKTDYETDSDVIMNDDSDTTELIRFD